MTTHVVCHSGGEGSALTAIEVARKFGTENVILVNHDIHPDVEDADVKRFKREIAGYLDLPITYVNYKDATLDQFDVCVQSKAFSVTIQGGVKVELCTSRLKTEPFMTWLRAQFPDKDCIVYYGFDASEQRRIQRRASIMGEQGYQTAYPLAMWPRTIHSTREIGIVPPLGYSQFSHANCIGCLKAGWQHWYIVYCTRPDIWNKGKWAEEEIGYAIHHDDTGPVYLEDMEETFEAMRRAGIPQTEHIPQQRFWAQTKRIINISVQPSLLPCECTY